MKQVVKAFNKILTLGSYRFAKHFGIGQRKVAGGQRINILTRVEVNFVALLLVHALNGTNGVEDML